MKGLTCENCSAPINTCHKCGKKIKTGQSIYCEPASIGNEYDTATIHFCNEKCWNEWLVSQASGTETTAITEE